MNLVYGVSGEGLGHVFEAIEVINRLQSEGHAVKVLTYGDRACDALARFAPTRIEGITLTFTREGMSVAATVRANLGCIPFFLRHWGRLRRELEAFRPDIFVTAYEPFTMVAAHVLRRPLVSMDNQNELLHLPRPPGAPWLEFRLVQLATLVATHGAAAYVVKSYTKAVPSTRRHRFVSPLIQRETQGLRPTEGDHVLVYLTKPNPELLAVLATLPGRFIVYCHDRTGTEGNLEFRARGPTFLPDLASARAIIGTTGFSLIADAIFLGKPYFGVPLRRQFEQVYNALYLARLGLGDYAEAPTREQLAAFLADLPRYRARLRGQALDPREQEATLVEVLAELARRPAAPVI
jgi:uncharacterized protein (TIGR00661 family)